MTWLESTYGRMFRGTQHLVLTGRCATPGLRLRSGGMGKGLGRGRGRGPIGIPYYSKIRGY